MGATQPYSPVAQELLNAGVSDTENRPEVESSLVNSPEQPDDIGDSLDVQNDEQVPYSVEELEDSDTSRDPQSTEHYMSETAEETLAEPQNTTTMEDEESHLQETRTQEPLYCEPEIQLPKYSNYLNFESKILEDEKINNQYNEYTPVVSRCDETITVLSLN